MKNTIFKTYYALSAPFVKGNWAKLFMTLEEIEVKKQEALPRVIVRIEVLGNDSNRKIRKDLTKLLGRNCSLVSDGINGVIINNFLSDYGRSLKYITSRLCSANWRMISVCISGGLTRDILDAFESDSFYCMDTINVRPGTPSYDPLESYATLIQSAYSTMIYSLRPSECTSCSGDCDGDYYIDSDWKCTECGAPQPGTPELMGSTDTAALLAAIEDYEQSSGQVFLKRVK